MKVEQVVCDVCGARQGAGKNGWWSLIIDSMFMIGKPTTIRAPNELDICSAQCAAKKLNEFMMPDKAVETSEKAQEAKPKEKHYDLKESKVKVDEVHWSQLPQSLQKHVIKCTFCRGEGSVKVADEKANAFVVEQCERCKGTGIEP